MDVFDSSVSLYKKAQRFFEEKQYLRLRNLIWLSGSENISTEIKVKLAHLWKDSLYAEASSHKSLPLSTSTKYKLRKRNPCPLQIDPSYLKAKNARLPKEVHEALGNWLKSHYDNPYPNKEEKNELAALLSISAQQVNRWFIQRRKILRLRRENQSPKSEKSKNTDFSSSLPPPPPPTTTNSQPPPPLTTTPTSSSPFSFSSSSSLLERILTTSPGLEYGKHYVSNRASGNGGSVEIFSGSPLTPPHSISEDSRVSLSPETFSDFESPLDLSLKSKEFDSPFESPLYPSSQSNIRNSICSSSSSSSESHCDERMMAVSALLSLSRHSSSCDFPA